MPFCTNCGEPINSGAKFCMNCGTQINYNTTECKEQRKQEFAGKVIKCPVCGEELSSFTAICPSCGHEINSVSVSSSLKELITRIDDCDLRIANSPESPKKGWSSWSKKQRGWWVVLNIFTYGIPLLIYFLKPLLLIKRSPKLSPVEKQKAAIIENYVFPNDRGTIIEALLFIKSKVASLATDKISSNNAYWINLWTNKASQLYQSAEILIPGDKIVNDAYQEIIFSDKIVKKNLLVRFLISIGVVVVAISLFFAFVYMDEKDGIASSVNQNVTYDWTENEFTNVLPKPKSEYGEVKYEYSTSFSIEIYKVSTEEYNSYVKTCRDDGFDNDISKITSYYSAKNDDGYDLTISYYDYEDKMTINISKYYFNSITFS